MDQVFTFKDVFKKYFRQTEGFLCGIYGSGESVGELSEMLCGRCHKHMVWQESW